MQERYWSLDLLAWYPREGQSPRAWLNIDRSHPGDRPSSMLGVLLAIVSASISLVGVLFIARSVGAAMFCLFGGFVSGLVLFSFVFPSHATRVAMTRVFRTLADKRCGACGYDMREIESSSQDGCSACPECGAAWKLDTWASGFVLRPARNLPTIKERLQSSRPVAFDARGWPWPCNISEVKEFPLSEEQKLAVRRAYWDKFKHAPVIAVWLTVVVAGVPIIGWIWAHQASSRTLAEHIAALVVLTLLLDIVLRLALSSRQAREIERRYRFAIAADQGRCPICVSTLPCDPCNLDGCTLCANCGGATLLPESRLREVLAT